MNDKGIDMLINITRQICVEPSILLLSSEAATKSGEAFCRLPWSCVYTTQRSEQIESAFVNPQRRVVGIISSNDSSTIRLNNREMPFVRLLGIEPEASDPVEQLTTAQVFLETIPRLLQPYGCIVIDYDDAHPEIMQQLYIQLNKLSRKKAAYLFGIKDLIDNAFIQRLVEKGVAIVFEESLWDSLEILVSTEYEWDDSVSAKSVSSEGPTIFIRKNSYKLDSPLDRELLLNIDSFASLLNYEDVEIAGSFPASETMQRFQAFLQSSTVGKPQWYGYRENSSFHLKRYFEEDLFQKAIKALESAGSKERKKKPIMLRGQACCGKTNALCALAYRVFHEGIYPVIYIPDGDVDFNNVYETNDDCIVESTKSDAFLSLEALLRQIEGKSENPVPALIIWDTSCCLYNEIKNGFELLSNLRSVGRQVQIICTSHGIIHNSSSDHNPYDYYDTIDVDSLLKGQHNQYYEHPEYNEVEHVQKMLIDFGGFQPEDASRMMRYYSASETFIGSLYLFRELHRDLKKRLRRENEGRIEDIAGEIETLSKEVAVAHARERIESVMAIKLRKEMERVGWQLIADDSGEPDANIEEDYENHRGKIEELVCCIAFCTIYKEKLPMAMAVRLLGTIDIASSKIFGLVLNNSLLRSEMSMDDEPVVSIRSELEAKLLLDEYGISRIETLHKLIDVMSYQEGSADVRLVQSLIQITGPNNVNSELSLWNANFDGFEKLINVLRQFREEMHSDVLLMQELTLTRELCNHRQWPYGDDKKLALLRDAKTLAEAAIDSVAGQLMTSFSANLFVEWANICLRLSQKDMFVSKSGLYRDISMKMELVIRRYPKNGYAYSAYLWAGIAYARELLDSGDEKLMLIQSLCNVADTIQDESGDIGLDANTIGEIDNLMDSVSISEARFNQSIKEGKSYGLYYRIRKIIGIGDNRLDFAQPLGKETVSRQKCEQIVEIVNMPAYCAIIETDPACMYAVINAKWLRYSGQPIIPSQENTCIGMSQDNWTSIHSDCKLYLDTLCRFRSPRIVYLQALSAAHIPASRIECEGLFDELRRGTNFEKRSLHVLCDEGGNPLLFDGQLSGKYNTYKNRGYIQLNSAGFSKVIYFRAERIGRNANSLRENERFHDLSIAVSYSGFQVCKL